MNVLTPGTVPGSTGVPLPLIASQSGSTSRSIWYQTTDTLPLLPATLHGHSTLELPWCARLTAGVNRHPSPDPNGPMCFPATNMIWFGVGVSVPNCPPLTFGTTLLHP